MHRISAEHSSGYTANVIVLHGVLEQGINFLEKPYSASALELAVRRVLDGMRQHGGSRASMFRPAP